MLEESEKRNTSTIHCANLSCGSTIRLKDDDAVLGWLRFRSDKSSGFFLGKKWLCSEFCLTKQVNEGILATLARQVPGKLFKPMGPRIGSFLSARGWINSEQLNQALEYQQQHELKLGKCLLALEYLSEQNLLTALSEQLKIPCIFQPISSAAEEALTFVPKPVCSQFHLVPFDFRQDHILSVAVDIDLSEEIILAVQEVLGCCVQPYLTTRKAIQELLERFVLPRPDEPVTLIDNTTRVADGMGRKFLEEWTRYQAKSARFASFEDLIWIRYLSAKDVAHNHLLLSDQTIPLGSCPN